MSAIAAASGAAATLTGPAAMGDWRQDAPGVRRRITASDLPPPFATRSASNTPSIVDPAAGAAPRVPAGFSVGRFATGLDAPRLLRVAPNGDVFVAETGAGRIEVLRAADGAQHAERRSLFADGLDGPFGIAFTPPGATPEWVTVATENAVIRFAYRSGDLQARSKAEVIVPQLATTTGGHSTRDVQFTQDGKAMLVSVGSGSNAGQEIPRLDARRIRDWEALHGTGAAWGYEADRADLLAFDSAGGNRRTVATGLRNCVTVAIEPVTGAPWCATNERDGLGDNLVPDYVTRIREGGFYGWPWYYLGANQDPRHRGERPDLAGRVTVPDVLLQSHSAPLQMAFYAPPAGAAERFPAAYDGDAFVALHGSWNRSARTGYKLVRLHLSGGVPDGGYEDFLTGFVVDADSVWGRPVGVATAHDGALLVSDDASGTIWRIVPTHP